MKLIFILLFLLVGVTVGKQGISKEFELQLKETNTPNFVRLFVMRLIFGIAKTMGLEDRLSGFLGGVFVPPGADDYSDYGDYDDYGSIF